MPLLYLSHCSLPQLPQRRCREEQSPSETRMSLLGTPCHKPHPKLKQENGLEIPSSLGSQCPHPTCPTCTARETHNFTQGLRKHESILSSQGPWEAPKAGTTMLILQRRKRVSKTTQWHQPLNPHYPFFSLTSCRFGLLETTTVKMGGSIWYQEPASQDPSSFRLTTLRAHTFLNSRPSNESQPRPPI